MLQVCFCASDVMGNVKLVLLLQMLRLHETAVIRLTNGLILFHRLFINMNEEKGYPMQEGKKSSMCVIGHTDEAALLKTSCI